jgi:hypothetical protein
VNYIGSNGGAAPTKAAGYGYSDMVEVLSKGADPAVQMNDGLAALDLAITGLSDIDRFTVGQRSILTRAVSNAGSCTYIRKPLETSAISKQLPSGR